MLNSLVKLSFVFCTMCLLSCSDVTSRKITWSTSFQTLGTFSSPKCSDLNGDGVLDVVMGAGLNEFTASDSAIVALDGTNGELLWITDGIDQMVGSAVFTHINEDKIADVVIGGRSAQLKAIDGATGYIIWKYSIDHHNHDAKGYTRFNFFNPQIVKDIDQDEIDDILISNGGNINAYQRDGSDRYPGVLAILSGEDGSFIAVDTMPDGQETYMSPALIDLNNDGSKEIIYGSGGETQGGGLFISSLEDLMKNDLSQSIRLQQKDGHGFIAPVVTTDLTDDGILDIVANWHGGSMVAIDGRTYQKLWEFSIEGTELNAMPIPGDVTNDGVEDLFTTFYEGAWPKNHGAIQVIVDGSSGELLYQDSIGCSGLSSALAYDFNADRSSEFLFSVNEYECDGIYLGFTRHRILQLDYANQRLEEWVPPRQAKNLGSTPWLGDMNNDGTLELIYCMQANYNDIGSFYGMVISRMDTGIPVNDKQEIWTEYQGRK